MKQQTVNRWMDGWQHHMYLHNVAPSQQTMVTFSQMTRCLEPIVTDWAVIVAQLVVQISSWNPIIGNYREKEAGNGPLLKKYLTFQPPMNWHTEQSAWLDSLCYSCMPPALESWPEWSCPEARDACWPSPWSRSCPWSDLLENHILIKSLSREEFLKGKVSLYSWSPVGLDWILQDRKICC